MKTGRITFAGNPWPEGHAIAAFRWTAERRDDEVWYHLHLESESYYAARAIDSDEADPDASDWEAPSVWGNYHRCTLSSSKWYRGGFLAGTLSEHTPSRVDGRVFQVDPPPHNLRRQEHDERAFHIYLLGHDAVVDHRITFTRRPGTDLFDIAWEGRIALVYAGSYEPKHAFRAEIAGVAFPAIEAGVLPAAAAAPTAARKAAAKKPAPATKKPATKKPAKRKVR